MESLTDRLTEVSIQLTRAKAQGNQSAVIALKGRMDRLLDERLRMSRGSNDRRSHT